MAEELETKDSKLYPASPILSDMPKGSGNKDGMSDGISILQDEKDRFYEYVARIRFLEVRAWSDTMKIPDPSARHIIVLYYFQRVKTWEEVAEEMNYSLSQTKRIRDSAYEFLLTC